MRDTKQRRIILQVLRETTLHPSADEIYIKVKTMMPNISLGTVYRNLDQLTQQHIIKRLSDEKGHRRFDANVDPHAHFICVECGVIEDVPFVINTQNSLNDDTWCKQREVLEIKSEILGRCPECKNKAKL